MKSHFVFDLDDTLTDSYKFNQQIFVETFAPYVDLSKAANSHYLALLHLTERGSSMRKQFEKAARHFSIKIKVSCLVRKNEELQLQNINRLQTFDCVRDFIVALKNKGKEVSILSNRDPVTLNKILLNEGLNHHLNNTISCSKEGHEKPDPYCLIKLVKESGQGRKNFLYFGDSETDKLFAQKAGIDFWIIDHYQNQKKFYRTLIQAFI